MISLTWSRFTSPTFSTELNLVRPSGFHVFFSAVKLSIKATALTSFSFDWKAYLDGKKTELLRADFNFQAVFVPQGRHLLVFKYEPKSFLTGGLISFFAVANLALLGVVFFLHFLWQKKK